MSLTRLIHKRPLIVAPEQSVQQAARGMVERGVGAATVIEANRIVGVVTERDVLKKIIAAGLDAAATPVRDIMTREVLSVNERTSVAAAGELMRKHHVRHLVVLDDEGHLAGMLSQRYVLYEIMDDLERKVGDLEGFLMTDGPGG